MLEETSPLLKKQTPFQSCRGITTLGMKPFQLTLTARNQRATSLHEVTLLRKRLAFLHPPLLVPPRPKQRCSWHTLVELTLHRRVCSPDGFGATLIGKTVPTRKGESSISTNSYKLLLRKSPRALPSTVIARAETATRAPIFPL